MIHPAMISSHGIQPVRHFMSTISRDSHARFCLDTLNTTILHRLSVNWICTGFGRCRPSNMARWRTKETTLSLLIPISSEVKNPFSKWSRDAHRTGSRSQVSVDSVGDHRRHRIALGQDGSSALVSTTFLDPKTGRPLELVRILEDVRNLQSKQTSLNDKLSYMQTENQALWGEIGSLRQKHSKQQQVVSKLMEFLLNFVASQSNHSHEQSVGQQTPNVTITNDSFSAQHHNNNSQSILNEKGESPNTLKRKQAALMHGEEPNKRTTAQQQQQQQQQQQFSRPMHLGRQQSVTINELADNDPSGWGHGVADLPLVDLVPSPPPSIQNIDDNRQQQPVNYRWTHPTNEPHHGNVHDPRNLAQPNNTFSSVGNGDQTANSYIPDFVLRTDNGSGPRTHAGTAEADIKTVTVDAWCRISLIWYSSISSDL